MSSGPGLLRSPGRLAGGAEDHAAKGLVARVWGRLPVIVRAFLVATLVTFAGNTPWAVLVLANLQLRPDVPWAVLVMAAYLGLYWQYLGGRWWPRSTAAARRRDLRAHPLSPRVWRWSLLAGGLAMATLFAMKPVVGRLVTLRYAVPDLLLQLPLLTLVSTLLMTSVVAGLVEEAAYRGYMQAPIERRHGPAVAIVFVSVIFGLAHLTDLQPGMTPARMLFILAASVGYGLLAHLTGSILPGLVLHVSGDALAGLLLWWLATNVGRASAPAAGVAGALGDPLFWLYGAETVVLGVATVWAFRRLAMVTRGEREAGTAVLQ